MTEQKNKPDRAAPPTTAPTIAGVNPQLIDAVEISLDAMLGNAHLTVADLSRLEKGSVVTLDATLNTAITLHLNGIAVARGELVAVGDHFAVRLTDIAS